jgi:S-adenosylmethionine:tRNA ribosyltransferase-isomerase
LPQPNLGTSDDRTFDLSAYHYHLPPERIAQNPVVPRDRSRLLVVNATAEPDHRIFQELPQILKPGDLLVRNNTRVFPARLYGTKTSGAQVEVLLIEPRDNNCWLALVKPGRKLLPGAEILFQSSGDLDAPISLNAKVLDRDDATGGRILEFYPTSEHDLDEALERLGQVPLPPYINDSQATPEQYQTVYAQTSGSVAAPTAGLHFTPELIQALEAMGIQFAQITLHVGVGTFRPVSAADIRDHQMHAEWIDIPQSTVDLIQSTQARGGRVIAIGTTVTRALEGAAQSGTLQAFRGKVNLFIYPGYQWQVIQGLITNFHLPGSSLMMLVSALVGRERLLGLYETAIAHDYRFYSFGDAMLITPDAIDPARTGG